MLNSYSNVICIHPKDETTDFLKPIGKIFNSDNHIVDDNQESHDNILRQIESYSTKSLIIFLGHGRSYCLQGSNTINFAEETFISVEKANQLFINHDVLLLACKSSEFISLIKENYNSIIGFGNIISSLDEVSIEAEYSGNFRKLAQNDIDFFNKSYTNAIAQSFTLLVNGTIKFRQLPSYISYFINKSINFILRQSDEENRYEIAKLLFEFRNDMILK